MTRKLRILLLSTITGVSLTNTAFAFSSAYIAKVLNWVPESSACNFCKGHYAQPEILIQDPNPKNPNQSPSQITATGPSTFATNGVSILTQNVVMTQPGRIVDADKAYIYRDATTRKINRIHLVGHVRMAEFGKLIVANSADFYPQTRVWRFEKPIYHVSENTLSKMNHTRYHYEAFGSGNLAARDQGGILHLQEATYSTCSPLNPSWEISAKKLELDQPKGRGYAHNVVLKVKRVPVFYFPYLNFPLNNQRHSGFLGPTFSSSKQRGFETALPYYWNMAPNYDMTIIPKFMTRRGLLLSDNFRYLFPHSYGHFYEAIIPYDFNFSKYARNNIVRYQNTPGFTPYLNELNYDEGHPTRGFFSVENATQFSHAWSSYLKLNYVTDDYYFRDFGTTFTDMFANQLQNEFQIKYEENHWSAITLFQWYQTLHLIGQLPAPENQYQRLPEIDVSGHYPNFLGPLNFDVDAQFVEFAFHSIFPPTYTFQKPVGQRFHADPTLSLPLYFSGGYITPTLTNDFTFYDAQSATLGPAIPRTNVQASRDLPIFNIDSGLYFQREFFNGKFEQTFEPRLFYLYVPYQNQNNLPFFDSQLVALTYDQLFSTNRISGFDRVENANQISTGAVTRIINSENGNEILNAGIGIEYYFDQPRVPILNSLGQIVLPTHSNTSPIVGEITYYPWQHWSLEGNFAWDFSQENVNNAGATLTYSTDKNRTFRFTYLYAKPDQTVPLQSFGVRLVSQMISLGVAWPINRNVNGLAYAYYDLSNHRPQSIFAGLEYSTCCWAVRGLVSSNLYQSNLVPAITGTRVTNQYQTVYYLQFLLKGLGDFGTSDPSTLLKSALPGYVDPFKPK